MIYHIFFYVMVRRRYRRRQVRRRRPRRRVYRSRRFKRFVLKRNRGRRRRSTALKSATTSVTGIDAVAFWNRVGSGLTDSDYATFNIYPFPFNPYGGTSLPSPQGTFVYGAQSTLLNSNLANPNSPILPAILEGHSQLYTASAEISKFAQIYEQFRVVSVELTFIQNKRPGNGNTDAGASTGFSNNIYILYNYLQNVSPQAIKGYFGNFIPNVTQDAVNKALPFAYYQDWNDIAAVSMESNRAAGRSGWHRKLLTPEKPVKIFYRPKHYPIGGSNAMWIPVNRTGTTTQTIVSWPNPVQATRMSGGFVSCDYLRINTDTSLNLLWTGPAILFVDSSTGSSGSYSVGPLGGANNVFAHLFGVTCRYHIKLAFRGLRKDRYIANSKTDASLGGVLTSEPAEWESTGFTQTFTYDADT